MIPDNIKIQNSQLPDGPGVYFYYDVAGKLLYVGKATSLKRRVGSYFIKAHDRRIEELVRKIRQIKYIETPTVIEALILEANKIKTLQPRYNILQRDDKSFMYLVITNESYPRPKLVRGHDLKKLGINPFRPKPSAQVKKHFLRVFGPYTSSRSLRMALELVRRVVPWSDCLPPDTTGKHRPCFNASIGRCPGVCEGKIDKREYRRVIRQLILFFEGKKKQLVREIKKEMDRASKELRFEDAAVWRQKLFALEHIQDVALIGKEDVDLPYVDHGDQMLINLNGRIEAYDISAISGTAAVGSMVVFENGKPAKDQYRKFKIKTVKGFNDVAMLEEVMRRRLRRAQQHPDTWPLPELMVIDGGKPQVNRIQEVFDDLGITIPIVGLAKGFDRKQDVLIFDRSNKELVQVTKRGKEIFQRARDEAHRFAVRYHRELRRKKQFGISLKKKRP